MSRLPEDALEWFRKHISGFVSAAEIGAAFGKYAELRDYGAFIDRFALLFDLCRRIADHPRHLGSHSSGLVIGGAPLSTLNVVTPSARGVLPIVMLDKDDVEEAGAIKLDILSLPILAVVQDSSASIRKTVPGFEYDQIPREDMETYRMLWSGDNMGLFQLGSPAQAALATRLHPRHFEDLVAAIGLIRPGPIRSQAARNYVAARNGYARIEVLHPSLEPILRRTHGVMCFQEQVGLVIGAMMGLSDVDADVWRKALTKHAKRGTMQQARDEFIARSTARHRDLRPDRAHRLMDELEGWVGLGFVEGHSASFALTGQKTAWMLRYHPTEYYAALLSNQPCGFYPPQSIASEARRRGAQIRPVDINLSRLECLIETDEDAPQSIRLGFCLVSGMREADIETILASRDSVGPLHSLLDFCKRVTIPRNCVENLIICGAFDALHDRRRSGLMWRLDETLGKAAVLRAQELESGNRLDLRFFGETETPLAWDVPEPSEWEAMLLEWAHVGVTSSCHPFAHVREALQRDGVISTHEAKQRAHHSRVRLAGLNVRPHRPPSKTGGRHLFCVLEDETGYLQLAFYGESIDNCTSVILSSPVIVVDGIVKRRGTGVGIEVFRAEPLSMERLVQSSFTVDMLTQPPVRPAAAR